jgi:hypothetical protein
MELLSREVVLIMAYQYIKKRMIGGEDPIGVTRK